MRSPTTLSFTPRRRCKILEDGEVPAFLLEGQPCARAAPARSTLRCTGSPSCRLRLAMLAARPAARCCAVHEPRVLPLGRLGRRPNRLHPARPRLCLEHGGRAVPTNGRRSVTEENNDKNPYGFCVMFNGMLVNMFDKRADSASCYKSLWGSSARSPHPLRHRRATTPLTTILSSLCGAPGCDRAALCRAQATRAQRHWPRLHAAIEHLRWHWP